MRQEGTSVNRWESKGHSHDARSNHATTELYFSHLCNLKAG